MRQSLPKYLCSAVEANCVFGASGEGPSLALPYQPYQHHFQTFTKQA